MLTGVPGESLPACEETFGPVVRVESVPLAAAAVEAANGSAHGLNGSVWTGDRECGAEIARDIECGIVNANDAYATAYAAPGAPMGGLKDSGIGHRQGPEGLKRYVEAKTIGTSRIGPIGSRLVPDRLYARAVRSWSRLYRRLRRKLR